MTTEEGNVSEDIFSCPLHLLPRSVKLRQKWQRRRSLQGAVFFLNIPFLPLGLAFLLLVLSKILGTRWSYLLDSLITTQFLEF